MSQDGQIILAGIFCFGMAGYAFYLSRSEKSLRKMVDNMKKKPFFVSKRVDFSEQYFRFFCTFAAVFFVFCGLLTLITRMPFSHTIFGEYVVKTTVIIIFTGGIVAIIYASWRFRK
jgi:hypothetical protein